MKKFLSCKKVAVIFLAVTILFLGIYVYMLARPISYGMAYHNVTEYNGGTFEGTIKLGANGIMVNKNTNFENAIETRYYYKNGYVFDLNATDDKGAEKEIDYINKNFETAIKVPFYASKINAFQFVAEDVGISTVYTCTPAIVFAIIGGVVELALIGFTTASFLLSKKNKKR